MMAENLLIFLSKKLYESKKYLIIVHNINSELTLHPVLLFCKMYSSAIAKFCVSQLIQLTYAAARSTLLRLTDDASSSNKLFDQSFSFVYRRVALLVVLFVFLSKVLARVNLANRMFISNATDFPRCCRRGFHNGK